MVELNGISNLGFSFTDIYLQNICELIKFVKSNKNKTISYIDLQSKLGDPSRIRMIVPFLRYMNVVDSSYFEHGASSIDLNNFFTKESIPFIKCCEIYDLVYKTENEKAKIKWRELFNELLLELYLRILCKQKDEYLKIIKYFITYKSLDKFEFFVITSFEYNGEISLFGEKNIDNVISRYRKDGIDDSLYTFKSNINSFSYIMQVLSDFGVCNKNHGKFIIKNEEKIKKALEGLL